MGSESQARPADHKQRYQHFPLGHFKLNESGPSLSSLISLMWFPEGIFISNNIPSLYSRNEIIPAVRAVSVSTGGFSDSVMVDSLLLR